MSSALDSLLDPERREQIARSDEEMAYGITHTRPVKVAGRHLSEAPNEPFPVLVAKNELACSQLREDIVQQYRNAGVL